jgi:hypothetical protein
MLFGVVSRVTALLDKARVARLRIFSCRSGSTTQANATASGPRSDVIHVVNASDP